MNTTLLSHFYLDPQITFLNFGSFGATPRVVMEDYRRWQTACEREPVQFLTVKAPELLYQSREALGKYVNCRADDLVFVTNPSYAVNIVAKSLNLKTGDEVLASNLEYGACDKTWSFCCGKKGARYIRQKITLPLRSDEQFVEDLFQGVTSNTKLIFLNQITSATALILPVQRVCEKAKALGIPVFIDGAHVPGHIPLDITALDPDYYTGACHKWMMAPKGCSFLYAAGRVQNALDPLVVSWGYDALFPSSSKFIDYHQLQGTRDISAFLTIPACLQFMQENDWKSVSDHCRRLVLQNAPRFVALTGLQAASPFSERYIAQMFSFPVLCDEPEKLKILLYEKYKIEIPVFRQDADRYIRYSINGFNDQEDLDQLYDALREIRSATSLLG